MPSLRGESAGHSCSSAGDNSGRDGDVSKRGVSKAQPWIVKAHIPIHRHFHNAVNIVVDRFEYHVIGCIFCLQTGYRGIRLSGHGVTNLCGLRGGLSLHSSDLGLISVRGIRITLEVTCAPDSDTASQRADKYPGRESGHQIAHPINNPRQNAPIATDANW